MGEWHQVREIFGRHYGLEHEQIEVIVLIVHLFSWSEVVWIRAVHFETEPKNHTENKPNRTNFMVFMVYGFGMVWNFHTVLNFGFYGIYRKTERLTE